jgi:hypothetical protein
MYHYRGLLVVLLGDQLERDPNKRNDLLAFSELRSGAPEAFPYPLASWKTISGDPDFNYRRYLAVTEITD